MYMYRKPWRTTRNQSGIQCRFMISGVDELWVLMKMQWFHLRCFDKITLLYPFRISQTQSTVTSRKIKIDELIGCIHQGTNNTMSAIYYMIKLVQFILSHLTRSTDQLLWSGITGKVKKTDWNWQNNFHVFECHNLVILTLTVSQTPLDRHRAFDNPPPPTPSSIAIDSRSTVPFFSLAVRQSSNILIPFIIVSNTYTMYNTRSSESQPFCHWHLGDNEPL